LNPKPPTNTAPPDQRGGTYERDSTARALLWYGTHTIHNLRRDRKITTFGSNADRDIQIIAGHISGRHGRIESRARGMVLIDERSKNGTYYETKRTFGLGLQAHFEDLRVPAEGFHLRPGTTFLVGDRPHRYLAIDGETRKHHPALLDLLGTEDEVRGIPELVSPSDFILAADSGGHLLITGDPTCAPDELAQIAHKISKRRGRPFLVRDRLPDDPEAQRALVVDDADSSTLVLNLLAVEGGQPDPLDPRTIAALFSPSYQIRVIVLTRTLELASALLGEAYTRPMMHVPLRPLAQRPGAIGPMLDRWFALHGSPLRVADLAPENRRRVRRTTGERSANFTRRPSAWMRSSEHRRSTRHARRSELRARRFTLGSGARSVSTSRSSRRSVSTRCGRRSQLSRIDPTTNRSPIAATAPGTRGSFASASPKGEVPQPEVQDAGVVHGLSCPSV
jgi:hypothetical protein